MLGFFGTRESWIDVLVATMLATAIGCSGSQQGVAATAKGESTEQPQIDGRSVYVASPALDPDVKTAWEAFLALRSVLDRVEQLQAEHSNCQPRIDQWAHHPTLLDYEMLDAVRRLAGNGDENVLESIHSSMPVVISNDEQLFIGLLLAEIRTQELAVLDRLCTPEELEQREGYLRTYRGLVRNGIVRVFMGCEEYQGTGPVIEAWRPVCTQLKEAHTAK